MKGAECGGRGGHAVWGGIVDPEDFAAASCYAEVGWEVGEGCWEGIGSGEGGVRLGL